MDQRRSKSKQVKENKVKSKKDKVKAKLKTHQVKDKKIKENQVEDIKEDLLGMKKTTRWQTHSTPPLACNWMTTYTHNYTLS